MLKSVINSFMNTKLSINQASITTSHDSKSIVRPFYAYNEGWED